MDAPAVQYVKTTDGYDIAYYARGSGPTLIRTPILWNNISRQWHPSLLGPAFDALAERFHLILYDARGQGLSARGLPEALSVDEYLLDLEAVADQAGGDRFILSGWSFMGVVAIKYAVQHPERVSALVLWDYVDMHASASWPTMTDLARKDWRLYVETTARTGFPQFDTDEVREVLFDAMTQLDHIAQARAIADAPGEKLILRLKVPTLLLASRSGARPYAGEESSKRWAAIIPNARLALFESVGGGWSANDKGSPAGVQAIEDFLVEIEARGADRVENTAESRGAQVLSPREIEVLRLLAHGKSNPEIAKELFIARNTVQSHVASILFKTNLQNRAQAAVYAKERGIA